MKIRKTGREFRISGSGASGVREWGGEGAARGLRKFGKEFRWGLKKRSYDRKWLGRVGTVGDVATAKRDTGVGRSDLRGSMGMVGDE